ncbi:DUF397 domain-containing protein [Streptomyces sp. NPDC051364]|uniref:DUF397 domain-containing protein n=1 Tax=Streptomyces sp. NPDC051364 TaxID=3155799 RepID=UPI00343DBADE
MINALNAADPAGADWFKSSYSGGEGNCVTVADLRATQYEGIAVRDSKVEDGPALILSPTAFSALIGYARTAV